MVRSGALRAGVTRRGRERLSESLTTSSAGHVIRLGDCGRFSATGTAIGPHEGVYTPSELRFSSAPPLDHKTSVARSHARNRATQASDLRFYGAPKGIRILIVLVTIGTRWYSEAAASPNRYQRVPIVTRYLGTKSDTKSGPRLQHACRCQTWGVSVRFLAKSMATIMLCQIWST
jgi:hypothetical protein